MGAGGPHSHTGAVDVLFGDMTEPSKPLPLPGPPSFPGIGQAGRLESPCFSVAGGQSSLMKVLG